MKVNKIAIIGGGSAGWMTASMLIKAFPNKEVILIESPNVPRVGVGESTYDGIQKFIHFLGIDMKDFIKETDANFKLAIKLSCFYNNDSSYDNVYAFGAPDLYGTTYGLDDWYTKKYLYPDTPVSDFTESYFPAASLIKYNTMSDNSDGSFGNFSLRRDSAYHFDAIKFAEWLKHKYAIPRGVRLVSDHVIAVNVSENGVDSLEMENGDDIYADLFIDCTGFKSLLIGESLGTDFISYNDRLPNNRAWAAQLPYLDKDKELVSITTATAIENGWVWETPLWTRLGAGYVYSDKFVTPENALEEFKNFLVNRKGRDREFVDSLTFRDIPMRVGIYDKVWNKNVVAIGLSAGFIEPLESNGLFSVHEFLFQLARALDRGVVSQWDKDVFNHRVRVTFDGFVDFIQLHYSLSIRTDTEYWRSNFNREYDFTSHKSYSPPWDTMFRTQYVKTQSFRPLDAGAVAWISMGYEYPLLDRFSISSGELANNANYKKDMQSAIVYLDNRKRFWNSKAKKALPLSEYLEKNYYS